MARTKKIEEAVSTVETTTEKKTTSKKKTDEASSKDRVAYFMKVKITFITPMLGTNPGSKDIYSEYIHKVDNKETLAEELERIGLTEVDEKGMTLFARDPKTLNPTMKAYMWRGFFNARSMDLAKVPGTFISTMKAYKKEVNLIFTTPRFPELILPEGKDVYITEYDPTKGPKSVEDMSELELKNLMEGVAPTAVDTLERPLRAQTMQGDRVALAKSETIPVGTTCELTFRCERLDTVKLLKECLNDGQIRGTGQWRNAGYGRFTWEQLDSWSEIIEPVKVSADEFPLR